MSWAAPSATGGWYPDPYRQGSLRWFDGRQWTHHLAREDDRLPDVVLPFSVWWKAVLYSLSFMVSATLMGLITDLAGAPAWLALVASIVVLFGGLVMTCAWMVDRHSELDFRTALGVRFRVVDLGWGALAWVGVVVSNLIWIGIFALTDIPFESNLSTDGEADSTNWWAVGVFAFAAVVVAPIVEELFFRGLLLRSLRAKLPAPAAIAVQAVIFGLYHLGPGVGVGAIGLVIVLTFAGAIFGVVAHRTRRLGPSMVAHCILNSLAMTVFIVTLAT